MALNNISFTLGQGGLGRTLPGQDYISGLVFYSASLPSGFTSTNRIKNFLSLADAESAGIVGDYSDATAATGTWLITTAGSTGDITKITVNDIDTNGNAQVTALCTYTKVTGDSTIALLGASIAAAINAGTNTHGYSASFTTATLTITAPKRLGLYLNSGTPITVTITGTTAGTLTQFSGGAGSKFAVWHYHISEFFRLQPNGSLFVGVFAIPGSYTFSEVTLMQTFAAGTIRQIGVYKDSAAFASADITAISGVCATLSAAHKEIIALYGADISGTSDISTLADLSQLTAQYCSAVIAQDGAAQGNYLYITYGKSITTLGALLGAIALAPVSESIAYVKKYNISNGTECDTIAFANGKAYLDSSITDNLLTQLQNYRYIFLRKFVGVSGSYFNENSTSIAVTSDYAYINNTRTIQKATRGVYANMVPELNGPITLDADGTIADYSAAYFQSVAEAPLMEMVRNGDLSAFSVAVNPSQNVLSTSTLKVLISLVPNGTARNIQVNIGFNVKIS